MKDLIKYTINPIYINETSYSTKYKISRFLIISFITLLLVGLAASVSVILAFFEIFEPFDSKSISNNKSIYWIITFKILLIPIIEELAFRLYLRFKPINIAISLGLIFYHLVSAISRSKLYEYDSTFYLRIVSAIVFGIIAFYLFDKNSFKKKCHIFWVKYFKYIFYFSVFLFAYVHLGKYSFNMTSLLLSPIILLPQIIGGVAFGYMRMNFGIAWSCILHILLSIITSMPLLVNS